MHNNRAQSLQQTRAGFFLAMADRDCAGEFEPLMRRADVTEQACA
jgi:hypothetical protein